MNSFTLRPPAARRCVWVWGGGDPIANKRDFYLVTFAGPLCGSLPPTAAANRASVQNVQRGVYLVTYRPVLSPLGGGGVACQKVTFLLPVAAHSSPRAPLSGLPGNYSQRGGATSARELLISVMSGKQLIQETLGFCMRARRGGASGGRESIEGGGNPLSQRGGSAWG